MCLGLGHMVAEMKIALCAELCTLSTTFQFRKALFTLTVGFNAFLVSPVLWSVHICSCLAFLLFLPELALLYCSVCTMTCFKYDVSGLLLKQSAPKSAISDNADMQMTFLFNKQCFITRVVFPFYHPGCLSHLKYTFVFVLAMCVTCTWSCCETITSFWDLATC